MSFADLIDSQVVMVTGKGGTGKTTFSAAIALVAAARGHRVVLCELDNQRPSMSAIFGKSPGMEPVSIRDNLDLCNIVWEEAIVGYLRTMIPSRRMVKLILDNAVIGRFLNFLPGAREIVTLSRLEQLKHDYDLVVVDMPASGHAFSLLDITRSALGLFRSGPVRDRVHVLIDELIQHRGTHLVFVGLPEEMVVNETLETLQRMRDSKLIGGAPAVFLNKATLPSLQDAERELLARLTEVDLDPVAAEFVRAGNWEDRLEQATSASQVRLAEAFPGDVVLVPPSGAGGNPRDVVRNIATFLGRQVGLTKRDVAWT